MGESELKEQFLKSNIGNIDLYVLAYELNQALQEGYILNVYEIPNTDTIIFKCRSKDGKRTLIIEPKKRINFTNFDYPTPAFPSQFILSLRKYIKGRRIAKIYQYNLDRILVIELKSSEGEPWKFVIEFFGGGNYILVNGDGNVHMAKSYKSMKNREIFAKKPYEFPTSKGLDFFSITFDTLKNEIQAQDGDLVRNLAHTLNMGGYIAEEICARASIDKLRQTLTLEDSEIESLLNQISAFGSQLQTHQIAPCLILNEQNQYIGFEPMAYKIYESYKFLDRPTFNETVDEFFSKFDSETLFSNDFNETTKVVTKTERILTSQLSQIEESQKVREKSIEQANTLFQYLPPIDNLISTIMTQRRDKKRSWEEIESALSKGKEQQIPECMIFEKIYPKEIKVEINIEGQLFRLDLKKNAIENANDIYNEAKKARRRIEGATRAIEDTKKKLDREKENQEQVLSSKSLLIKRPKQKWFEKFRWFISSDNFLIVGGRDAATNELLVKKHMSDHDLFFHTEIRGAPVCIIQNPENLTIPETTIMETAIFGVSYSSAWRQGLGNTEIYYVYPNQISKTPNAGEYLTKGSFIVEGKKNFVPKPYLEIAIGVKLILVASSEKNEESNSEEEQLPQEFEVQEEPEEKPLELDLDNDLNQYFPQVFSAPASAIQKQTQNFIKIRPSKSGIVASDLAKRILHTFLENATESEKKWVKMTSINDIIRVLPSGAAEFS